MKPQNKQYMSLYISYCVVFDDLKNYNIKLRQHKKRSNNIKYEENKR